MPSPDTWVREAAPQLVEHHVQRPSFADQGHERGAQIAYQPVAVKPGGCKLQADPAGRVACEPGLRAADASWPEERCRYSQRSQRDTRRELKLLSRILDVGVGES